MRFKIKESLALKLSLYIITAVVIIFISVLVYNYHISKRIILESNAENIYNLEQSTLNEVDNILLPVQKVAEGLGRVMDNASLSEAEIKDLLLDAVKDNKEIYGCTVAFEPYMFDAKKKYFDPYWYRPDGRLTYSSGEENDDSYDYFKWEWYTQPKKTGRGVWSEPYYDEDGGNIWMVTYSYPFYRDINEKEEFFGVVACDVSLDWLQELVSKIKIFESGYAFLLSSQGVFISHPNKTYFKKSVTFADLAVKYNDPQEKKIGEAMTSGNKGRIQYFSRTLQKTVLNYYQPLETTGWSLGIVISEDELYSKLDATTLELFIIGIIGYLITLAMIIFLSARATMPLRSLAKATQKIGQGDFNTAIPRVTSHDEIGMLSSSFIKMQDSLIEYVTNLKKTTAAKEKIERELIIAKEIQQSLLPHNFPANKEFDMYAKLLPAKEVAGDLYDFFFIDSERLCFAVGDVSGKGVPAALFMAIAKTLLRSKTSLTSDVAEVLNSMNKELSKESETAMFVTFFMSILNIRTGVLEYCSAGHNPPLIKQGDKFRYLNSDDPLPPLGVIEDIQYKSDKLTLHKNDIFCLYTDGITEAMSKDDVQFTDEKLLEIFEEYKDKTVVNIADNILSSVAFHASTAEQSDDITILVLKYNG
ncbi:MAG: SpoIIE family protein phosphatase [Lentisphaerota bacterium]